MPANLICSKSFSLTARRLKLSVKGLPVNIKIVSKFQLASFTVSHVMKVFLEVVLIVVFVLPEIFFEL